MSIMSFPDRGPWGKSSWRGNFSGHVVKALIHQTKPTFFIDAMMGSGTSVDVAKDMGVECLGLDLHSGFNILKHSILERAGGREACLVLTHPPYGQMIRYSSDVWGTEAHPDDLSHCTSDEDFHEKMHIALLNQRQATKPGGYYATVIGDLRSKGKYVSYQAEMIARMPADELASVQIKLQHNTMSGSRSYAPMKMPRIEHEYVIVWMKPKRIITLLQTLATSARQQHSRMLGTWRAIVKQALIQMGGKASLPELYEFVAQAKPEQLGTNPNWQAKIRQILQQGPFTPLERGVWALA
jgi:hypothetical protein